MLFTSKGRLRCSEGNSWWIILDCDTQIGKYYRTLFNSYHFNCKIIKKPSWNEHITVVRNEEPVNKSYWTLYNGFEIEFKYEPIIKTNDDFYWLDVRCDFLYKIRLDLGLNKEPEYPFHLTIGNRD